MIPLELAVIKATVLFASAFVPLRLLRGGAASARAAVCLLAIGGATLVAVLSLWPVAPVLSLDLPGFWFFTATASTDGSIPAGPALPGWAVPAIWLAGSAILALRYWLGVRVIRGTLSNSAPPPLDSAWSRLAHELAPGVEVRVADVTSPLACRLLHPTILIPPDSVARSLTQVRPVLLHELAHIRRRDLAANMIASLATVVFWFHPLVWVLAARLHREQELACDDAVLSQGISPHSYAEMLVESASGMRRDLLFGCAMAGRSGAFQTRVAHVLDSTHPRRPRRSTVVMMSAVFLTATLLLAACRPAASPGAGQIYRIGGDVAAPKLVKKIEPEYTPAARAARVQGSVQLHVVVGTDGRAHDIRVERRLDPGLDENAVAAIQKWQFEPGKRKGEPVAVQARVEVNFRLQ